MTWHYSIGGQLSSTHPREILRGATKSGTIGSNGPESQSRSGRLRTAAGHARRAPASGAGLDRAWCTARAWLGAKNGGQRREVPQMLWKRRNARPGGRGGPARTRFLPRVRRHQDSGEGWSPRPSVRTRSSWGSDPLSRTPDVGSGRRYVGPRRRGHRWDVRRWRPPHSR